MPTPYDDPFGPFARKLRMLLAAACLPALLFPPPDAAAQLVQESSGAAAAGIFAGDAAVAETPGPDSLSVTLGATAEDVQDNLDEQYLDDFVYQASFLGAGTVTWGAASGSLSLEAHSKPEFSPPVPGGPLMPLPNSGNAQASGRVAFRFDEIATVASPTLPDGTPVTVQLNCRLDVAGAVSGTLNPPNETRVGGSAECRITDVASGTYEAEILIGPNQIEIESFETAVGKQLVIEGVFRVVGEAYAGYVACCDEYIGDVGAQAEASWGLWFGMPPGVTLTGASGHDYTVPVPEPRTPLPTALAALAALACARARLASFRRSDDTRL